VEIIHSYIDSRIGKVKYKKILLENFVEELLFKCLKILHMKYTEIDLIIDEENVYILDCNPSPGFMALEEDVGLPISKKIAEYIVGQIR